MFLGAKVRCYSYFLNSMATGRCSQRMPMTQCMLLVCEYSLGWYVEW